MAAQGTGLEWVGSSSLSDLAKGFEDINDATIRNGAVIELQEKIFSAQEAQIDAGPSA